MKTYPIPTEKEIQRFWNRVDKTPGHGPNGNCWVWTRKGTEGYGLFWYQNRYVKPSRFSYELAYGPTDFWVLHRCDVRPCVNPAHLFAGTRKDNMVDCAIKERISTTVLTAIQVVQIKKLLQAGFTHRIIANSFAIDRSTVTQIHRGRSWKHLK